MRLSANHTPDRQCRDCAAVGICNIHEMHRATKGLLSQSPGAEMLRCHFQAAQRRIGAPELCFTCKTEKRYFVPPSAAGNANCHTRGASDQKNRGTSNPNSVDRKSPGLKPPKIRNTQRSGTAPICAKINLTKKKTLV